MLNRAWSVTLCCALLIGVASAAADGAGRDRETVLLITVDTLRADRLAIYGGPRQLLPAVSRWAREGAVFERAYATSSWTVPSVTSLLTSLYPISHGARHGFRYDDRIWGQESVPAAAATLADAFRAAGFATFAVVANPHLDRTFGFSRGFDSYALLDRAPAAAVVERVVSWGGAITASPKVLVWIHFMDPHLPYGASDEAVTALAPELSAAARQAARDYLARLRDNAGVAPASTELQAQIGPRRGAILALYDAEIAAVGQALDQLFSVVPRLAEGIVCFTADHGEEFLERGFLGHGHNLHAETTRVPLVLRLPRMPVAQRIPVPLSQVDLAPTLAALAGVAAPAGWSGHALLSADGAWLDDGASPVLSDLDRFELQPDQTALVDGRWRLLRSLPHGELQSAHRQLYDIAADAAETRDLAATHPDEVRRLELLLATLERSLPRLGEERREVVVSPHTLDALRALGYIQ